VSYDRDTLARLGEELAELADNIDAGRPITLARYVRLADTARDASAFLAETVGVLDLQARHARRRIAYDIIESRKRRKRRG
jgi:hypothetical protein